MRTLATRLPSLDAVLDGGRRYAGIEIRSCRAKIGAKRTKLMKYDRLRRQDLEVASGMVEGAVKHVIGKRFDNGSMRWIRERAEPLLQLRCIEINGQWSQFIAFVQRRLQRAADRDADRVRLLTNEPVALPTIGVSADNEAA